MAVLLRGLSMLKTAPFFQRWRIAKTSVISKSIVYSSEKDIISQSVTPSPPFYAYYTALSAFSQHDWDKFSGKASNSRVLFLKTKKYATRSAKKVTAQASGNEK
jgi:uncharacterized CHY-type Zn-finger protein